VTNTPEVSRLAELVPVLEAGNFEFGHWAGGDKLADGSIQMPYYELSERGLEIVRALPVVVFDWPTWMQTAEAQAFLADHAEIASATDDQLVKLSTALVRGDRFSDGLLANAFESGLLLAIARRAAELLTS
jgi:hypothetical protein